MPSRYLRILLAEQRSTATGVTLHSLCSESSPPHLLKIVSTRTRLFSSLRECRPDLVIVELALLLPNPVNTITIFRALVPELPLILLAHPADKDRAASCLLAGATDYMLEGFMDLRTMERCLHAALYGNRGLLPSRTSRIREESGKRFGGTLHELDRRHNQEATMRSNIGIRVTLRNLETMRDRLGTAETSRLMDGVGVFLRQRLRGTDRLESVAMGEFRLSIQNANTGCIPALERRISAPLLENHFRKLTNCELDFSVETEEALPTRTECPDRAWEQMLAAGTEKILSKS